MIVILLGNLVQGRTMITAPRKTHTPTPAPMRHATSTPLL